MGQGRWRSETLLPVPLRDAPVVAARLRASRGDVAEGWQQGLQLAANGPVRQKDAPTRHKRWAQ